MFQYQNKFFGSTFIAHETRGDEYMLQALQ